MNAKETFLKSKHRPWWEELVQTEGFRAGIESAMLVMVQGQADGGTPSDSWDQHSQLVGARRFVRILENLHAPEKTERPIRFPNLEPPKI